MPDQCISGPATEPKIQSSITVFGPRLSISSSMSAAIKLIDQEESGAENLVRYLKKGNRVLISSVLLQIELHSYLRRIRRSSGVNLEIVEYFENLSSHLLFRLILRPINSSQLEEAAVYLQESQIQGCLRSLDAIHFASFCEYADRIAVTVLLSADDSLIDLARENNKSSFNPLIDDVDAAE